MDQEKRVQDLISMQERLTYIFEHEYKPDFTIQVGQIEQPSYGRFKTHQGLLAACSGVFRYLLSSMTVVKRGYLHFSHSHSRIFKEILRYMYTNKIEYSTPNEFGYIQKYAIQYEVPGLVKVCEKDQYIVEINPENALDWLNASFKHALFQVRQRCYQIISYRSEEVFESESFMESDKNTLDYILRNVKLALTSELVLLKTIMKWIEAKKEYFERNNSCIPTETKQLLQFVNFTCINARDFEKVLWQYSRFLSPEVAIDIFRVITNPHDSLPDWMCKTWKRFYLNNYEEIDNRSGPNFPVQYNTFLMPMGKIKIVRNTSSLETVLRIRCNWMPTILVGATLICPCTDGKGRVKLHWECHTFGCFEEISNTMSFDRHVKVKKNRISIKFPKQFVLETSVVFHLSIKIEYDEIQFVDLPYVCVPSSENILFSPNGRNLYFDGDIIVSEILYI